MSTIRLSLVIPTFNRAEMLIDALQSVARSQVDDHSSIEVIVVDNNSRDNTRSEVEKLAENGFPFELRYEFERRQGVSETRNKGISVARAPYVVFMDDDQRIDPNYLARVEDIFEQTQAACIGGPVDYYNADNLPAWLVELVDQVGQFNAGDKPRPLILGERMLGTGNMAIRKSALANIGTFNESLGRRGNSLMGDEDIEIQERLCHAGETVFYSPDLIQHHYLRSERLTKGYWRRHRFDRGRTLYRSESLLSDHSTVPKLFGAPRWFWGSLLQREIPSYVKSIFNDSSTARFSRQLDIFVLLGKIYEARKLARELPHTQSAKRHNES